MDQAGRLMAFWEYSKNPSQGLESDDHNLNVVSNSLSGGDDVYYDQVGKMEDDLIQGGLPGQPSGLNFKQYSGPGCSSLGIGAMVEIGPFGVNPDGITLYAREHTWTEVANVLFVESPAGVGFSYSNTTTDYNFSGDNRTAQDAYTFVLNWFRRYPQYKDRDFYIAGERFYIPELTDIIINGNKEANPTSMIQLKGIMIGNGILDLETDRRGRYDYAWSHALISDETHQELIEHCLSSNSPKCNETRGRVGDEIGNIDLFNIYTPRCMNSNQSRKQPKCHEGFDPCEGNYVRTYLNLPQVQEALHANRTKLPYAWEACSGDMDAVVPVSSTRYSIGALNLTAIKPWRPWLDDVGEVGGHKVVYDGLTFATVRGAGHQATQSEPLRALSLFKYFLAGN
ncbi:hypothetical protein RHSIM_Rhsim11G0168300 [Rhododendron simsii]|uniref:Serine carboxypeptidase n=1 Tax=Rhododendron simsii TaxID=118357 RepID=A0A834G8J6_RHOSS|nr:hypothetical protein RHSIM_Rhsim11G0168300 [Rhododendron simsii]